MDIINEIKKIAKNSDIVLKLMFINIVIFLLVHLIVVIYIVINPSVAQPDSEILKWISVPANLNVLIYRPWTLITYMFLQYDIIHILFNMLWLYWFGKIFLQYLTKKQLLNVYILGGLAGAIFFILAFNIFPIFESYYKKSIALGASASVMAIAIAISYYVPNYTIQLVLIGKVKLKFIAIVVVVIDLISITSENSGGHIAHLGGAAFGFLFTYQLKNKKKDITKGFGGFMDNIFSIFNSKPKMKVSYDKKQDKPPKDDMEYNEYKNNNQNDIDIILEKISKSGYDSLTKKEKETLFKMSNKNKK